MRALVTAFLLAFLVSGAQTQQFTTGSAKPAPPATDTAPSPAALIARAKALELDTPYVAPPGDPLVRHAAAFAKVMCSAVFITGLDLEFAAENVGYFMHRTMCGQSLASRSLIGSTNRCGSPCRTA
jgi:hypothetical protein